MHIHKLVVYISYFLFAKLHRVQDRYGGANDCMLAVFQ